MKVLSLTIVAVFFLGWGLVIAANERASTLSISEMKTIIGGDNCGGVESILTKKCNTVAKGLCSEVCDECKGQTISLQDAKDKTKWADFVTKCVRNFCWRCKGTNKYKDCDVPGTTTPCCKTNQGKTSPCGEKFMKHCIGSALNRSCECPATQFLIVPSVDPGCPRFDCK